MSPRTGSGPVRTPSRGCESPCADPGPIALAGAGGPRPRLALRRVRTHRSSSRLLDFQRVQTLYLRGRAVEAGCRGLGVDTARQRLEARPEACERRLERVRA